MNMLEKLKQEVEAKGYKCAIIDGGLDILFQNGGLNSKGQPSYSWVGKVRETEGELILREAIIPFGKIWELNNVEGVMKFLLERYPNLAPGEELPDFDD